MAFDWGSIAPAAITAAASLLGGVFQSDAQDKQIKEAEKARKEELLAQLELEKFRILNQKGGGGGADRELAALEMALGVHDTYAARVSNTLQTAANRYAQIYGGA